MPASRNPAVRAQRAFAAPEDARSAIAAWPDFAKALHTAATRIDGDTALRFRRLAASAGTVADWNERATIGSSKPDAGVLALAKEISETPPGRNPSKAAARLDAIAWSATGTLLSRVQDYLADLRTSDHPDIATEIRDLRRTRATIAAANIDAEIDHRSAEGSDGIRPLALWEGEASRAVAKSPTTLTLWMVAVNQEVNTATMMEAVQERYRTGDVDGLDTERVLEALDANRQGWVQVRDSLQPLAIGNVPLPVALLEAGEVARAHLSDLQHGSVRQLRQNLAVFLASSVNLAATTTAVIESGQLHGPAAAINRRGKELRPNQVAAYVDPVALHQRRTAPIGEAIQADLTFQAMKLRDSLEWTGNVAKAGPWDTERPIRRDTPRREPPVQARGRSRDL
jgi:hypothetical protein